VLTGPLLRGLTRRGYTPLQYTSISAGRKAGHAVAHVIAVSKVSAIARPIPTVASLGSLGAIYPLLVRQIDVAMSNFGGAKRKDV
jgi:hypothetical protein